MEKNSKEYDSIVENIISLIPSLKTLFLECMAKEKDRTIVHNFQILFLLKRKGPMTMSEIGESFYISKPNMTTIVDKLIEDKQVKRIYDPKDRRVIRIDITEKGEKDIKKIKENLKKGLKSKLYLLNRGELETLLKSLEGIQKTITKINLERK